MTHIQVQTEQNLENQAQNAPLEEDLEHFIPVSKYDLLAELRRFEKGAGGDLDIARIFSKLEGWRHAYYHNLLDRLKEYYLPFSPDSDTINFSTLDDNKLQQFQRAFVDSITDVLIQANYRRVDNNALNTLLSQHAMHGLDLNVDMDEYEESLVFLRGKNKEKRYFRSPLTLWLKKYEYEETVFSRLFILLKLKPEERRIRELVRDQNISEKRARKILKKTRSNMPDEGNGQKIYLKVFKELPQSDLEMMFPNTEIKIKLFDKIKLGVTASGGALTGLVGLVSKIALIASNPIAFIIALGGFGAVMVRQVMNFFNTRNKYMLELSQRLYFHALADNTAALTLMTDRGEEEDIKEDILFYFFLSYFPVQRSNLAELDKRIEDFLHARFPSIRLDFEITDPLGRLMQDGVVVEDDQGWLFALPPEQAEAVLEKMHQRQFEMSKQAVA